MRPRRNGFTILELLVVVVMLGALAGLALPRMSEIIIQNRLQRAAQLLQTDVQQAFTIAGRNRQPVQLRWVSGELEFQVTNRDASTVFRSTGLGDASGFGFTSANVTVSSSSVQIFPNGLASDTLRITLSKSGFNRVIRVSRAGIVRTE